MLYTTTEYCRHTGIGNKLFPWSRAKILEQVYGVTMLQQNWISIRGAAVTRGGIDYSKVLGKIYLFNNFINDSYEISKLDWILNKQKSVNKIYVSNLEEAIRYLETVNNILIFKWNTDHFFDDFQNYRELILNALQRITYPSIIKKIEMKNDFIGVNIRLGNDFVEQDSIKHGYKKTAINWFLDAIPEIRKLHGNLPVYVVSDGSPNQLSIFKKINDVYLVNNNKAIEDLLFLRQAKVLLGSGNSSFAAWASFLGNMPTYASKITPFSNFKLKNTYEI